MNCKSCGEPMESATNDVCPKCLLGLGVSTQIEKPLEPGSTFHGLEILQMLGRGGMGTVYKARQPQLDRFVAVKVLPKAMAQNPEFSQRFMLEAKALASLSHPNIVNVHDFGCEGDQYFIVMEYIDGTNLRPLLTAKTISPKDALKIVPVLCDALQYAHSMGVVHRDIKPENVLIDKTGRVKIADFGLAKMVNGTSKTPAMTQTHVAMGTPHYMAPEQLQSAKSVDHRADIYSMGVMFYEMLTGELPLGRFEPPSVGRIEVDVRLDEIVLRALQKEPAKRYQTMGEVSRDVNRVSGISPSSRQPAAQSSSLPWVIGAAVIILMLGAILYSMQRNNTVASAPEKPASTSTSLTKAPPEDTHTAVAVNPLPGPPPPAKPDVWSLATIADGDLPPGWKIVKAEEAADRTEVLTYAGWWRMNSLAKHIDRARKVELEGPSHFKMQLLAYDCHTQEGLDACLDFMLKTNLPQYNHFLVQKENTFLVVGADREGKIAPDVETLEDTLRKKLGAPPAKRRDSSDVGASHLPDGWVELKKTANGESAPLTAKTRAELKPLLAAFPYVPAIKPEEFRDGWVKSYGEPSAGGAHVDVASIRFLESEDTKKFVHLAQTTDPPKDQDMRIIHDGDRVVFVLIATANPAHTAGYDAFEKTLRTAMRCFSDSYYVTGKVLNCTRTPAGIKLELEITGANARELRRSGKWVVTVYAKGIKDHEGLDVPPPTDFTYANEKWHATLDLPIAELLKSVAPEAKGLDIRIDWTGKGNTFDVECPLP
jgi:serine/threonine protein kinase